MDMLCLNEKGHGKLDYAARLQIMADISKTQIQNCITFLALTYELQYNQRLTMIIPWLPGDLTQITKKTGKGQIYDDTLGFLTDRMVKCKRQGRQNDSYLLNLKSYHKLIN
jgi:hypothetical protein